MYTQKYRPKGFKDIIGQDMAKRILKAIVSDPKRSPSKSIILEGSFGSGKTSLARVFGRELNSFKGKDVSQTTWFNEMDSSVVGNVDFMRNFQDVLYMKGDSSYYRVYVFDEVQLASKQAQGALLKVIEEADADVFFIFCTTDIDQVKDTIRSRSIELHLDVLTDEEVRYGLEGVLAKEGVEDIPEDIMRMIIARSKGHYRDALIHLGVYVLLGGDEFRKYIVNTVPIIHSYFTSIFEGAENVDIIDSLVDNNVVNYIVDDLEYYVYRFLRKGALGGNKFYDAMGISKVYRMFSFYVSNRHNVSSDSDLKSLLLLMGRFFVHESKRSSQMQSTGFAKR